MSDRIYYQVGPDAPVLAVINECIALRKANQIAALAFRDKYGAKDVMCADDSGRFWGLIFEGHVPDGWRRKDATCYVPNLRTKRGKEIAAETKTLPQAASSLGFSDRLSREFGVDFTYFAGSHMYWSTYGHVGGTLILTIPAGIKFVPEGCTEMLVSEVNRLIDAAKEAEAE